MKKKFIEWIKKPMLRKMGVAAFLFFLIKGLVWIAIGVWAYITLQK
jgi:hypothetical protein